jgi:hypothetical protein
MEGLFSPCTRLPDILNTYPPVLHELKLDVSAEELLSAERALTYADLYAVLGSEDSNTVAWLTPHAVVARQGENAAVYWLQLHPLCRFCFSVDGKAMIALAQSPEHISEICDIVLRLLAASVVHSVIVNNLESLDGILGNAPTLAHLLEQCPSLKTLWLEKIALDESHCRILDAYSRPDLDIILYSSNLTNTGTSALVESLRRNQGPTKLAYCHLDYSVLADGLRGNTRLKSLKSFIFSSGGVSSEEFLSIAGALKENKGLVDVELTYNFRMSDETWDILCDSLKTHPTLQILKLRPMQQPFLDRGALAYRMGRVHVLTPPDVLKTQIQALVDMLKGNKSIHTIDLHDRYSEYELYRESINPYLEKNRVHAIQRTSPTAYRAKLLGRALLSARADANRFWALLSGNAEVAFSSTNTMTTSTLAANLSTTAAVGASANAASGTAATDDGVLATNVADLASGQKRKARP